MHGESTQSIADDPGRPSMAMTVTELAEQVRDSNQRLAEAIQDLRGEMGGLRQELRKEMAESRQELRKEMAELRQEVADSREELKSFRIEVTEKLGAVDTKLEHLSTRVENSLSIAKWAVTAIIPIVIGAIIWSYYPGKGDPQVGRAFQPDSHELSGWKARPTFLPG
jgi:hypothetical protein